MRVELRAALDAEGAVALASVLATAGKVVLLAVGLRVGRVRVVAVLLLAVLLLLLLVVVVALAVLRLLVLLVGLLEGCERPRRHRGGGTGGGRDGESGRWTRLLAELHEVLHGVESAKARGAFEAVGERESSEQVGRAAPRRGTTSSLSPPAALLSKEATLTYIRGCDEPA